MFGLFNDMGRPGSPLQQSPVYGQMQDALGGIQNKLNGIMGAHPLGMFQQAQAPRGFESFAYAPGLSNTHNPMMQTTHIMQPKSLLGGM